MGFPSVVNAGGAITTGSGTSLTPGLPTRTLSNVLIAYVFVNATGKTFSVGGSWTIFDSINTANRSGALAWRIVDATETAPTFTWVGATSGMSQVVQWTGTAPITPIGPVVFSQTGNSGTSIPTNGLTSTADNSLVVNRLFANPNQTLGTLFDRTLIQNIGTAVGVTEEAVGRLNTSGTTSDAPSLALSTAADWISFTYEILGTGVGSADTISAAQVVEQVIESYSTPSVQINASQVVQQVAESYSTPIMSVSASQVVLQVLRSLESVNTLDKWYREWNPPHKNRQEGWWLQTPFVAQPPPPQETGPDRWLSEWRIAPRAKPRLEGWWLYVISELPPPPTITVDMWFSEWRNPARLLPRWIVLEGWWPWLNLPLVNPPAPLRLSICKAVVSIEQVGPLYAFLSTLVCGASVTVTQVKNLETGDLSIIERDCGIP